MLRTAQSLPLKGFRHWASTRPVSRPSRQPATGPPGSYPDRTSTGKRRRAYDQRSTTSSTSSLLGARNIRARLQQPALLLRRSPRHWKDNHRSLPGGREGSRHIYSARDVLAKRLSVGSRLICKYAAKTLQEPAVRVPSKPAR